MVSQARGLRNNNPGNIRKNDTKWQGLAEEQGDPSFFVFKDPVYGIRAIARLLITYQDQYDLHTIRQLINRWAPPSENDSIAYANSVVSDSAGVNALRDMHKYADLRMLVTGIIRHENGAQPYTNAQIDKALVLAGVEPPKKSIMTTRQGVGTAVAGTATVLGPMIQTSYTQIEAVKDQIAPFTDTSKYIQYAFVALTFVGLALVLWAKYDERRKGIS